MDKEVKNVYVITQGSYSDYSIVTVFDDKDKAKAFVEAYNRNKRSKYQDDYEIETYKVNEIDICASEGKIYFRAWTNVDGVLSVDVAPERDPERVGVVTAESREAWDWMTRQHVSREVYSVTVLAENLDKAKKIAADKIIEFKANKEGI